MNDRSPSEIILRDELGQVLLSTLQVNESLASQIPLEAVGIYQAGFRAAIQAIATAYQINVLPSNSAAIGGSSLRELPPEHNALF